MPGKTIGEEARGQCDAKGQVIESEPIKDREEL